MLRKFLCLLAALFVFSAIAATVCANDQTVFGPKTFKISRWHVHLSFHRFRAGQAANGIITITKNTLSKKIRGGYLVLNGKFISIHNFLRGSDSVFEKEISLRSKNYLMLFMRGTPRASVTIKVCKKNISPPPEITFSSAPQSIILGESSTLAWRTTNADSVSIDHGIGSVTASGALVVSPRETTTYALTAAGSGGTATKSVSVIVVPPAPIVNISADPTSIIAGETSVLRWNSTDADSCVIEPGVGRVDVNGSVQVLPTETTTYTVTVAGAGGSATANVTVTVIPKLTVEISAAPATILSGESSTLTWNATNADSCVIDNRIGSVGLSGSLQVSPRGTTTYTITATGAGGSATANVTVTVIYPEPTVEISASPAIIPIGSSSALSWTSANAYSVDIDQGIGSVDLNGSTLVFPTETTTYTITATGAGGTAVAGATITVTTPPPSVTFSATPQSIAMGESAVLSWGTANATAVTIDHGIGTVSANGSISVAPVETTVYTIRADGPGGTTTANLTVTVTYLPPTVSISADPADIIPGDASVLTWSSTNADTCMIEPGIGSVNVNGSVHVSPLETTTYTITATGPGGTATDIVTVAAAYPAPHVSFSANPQGIVAGESSLLSWSTAYADDIYIDHGIGNMPLNGSLPIYPAETTTYTILATGPGGTTSKSTKIMVSLPPPTVTFSAEDETIQAGESSILTWTSSNAQHVHIDNGIGMVTADGSMSVAPQETTTYTITVTGPTGSAGSQVTIIVLGNPEPLPENSFGKQYEDLIPPDATVELYDADRFSLISGKVCTKNGLPISDVAVTIHSHPEYGTAATDAAGTYAIPVEGGGTLTVVYQKDGLISTQRNVHVSWNEIAVVKTIEMISPDTAATTIFFDGDSATVITHQGTEVVDGSGRRSTTMVFTGDNQAYLTDEEGNDVQALAAITTRATEFKTPEAMPAKLPPNSAYTYCVELGVDGAQRVRFDKPVITWVDNFLGFNVGEPVPVGYYDRDKGVWVPTDNGVVVKLLDTDADGIVDALDANGDNLPDDLDNDGAFNDEVTGLEDALRYPPDATFWRVALTHFSPWDCNWPYGPPPDATPPNPPGVPAADLQNTKVKPCNVERASFVDERNRIFNEDIPIAGTSMTLHYASNRAENYKTVISVPASGTSVPESLKRIVVKVEIAGKTLEQILDPLPNQKAEFIWDGLDRFGRTVTGKATAHVRVGFVYDAFYYSAGNFARAFGQTGTTVTAIRARQEIYTWQESDMAFSTHREWGAVADGWTISGHHYFNPMKPSVLYKGNGDVIQNYTSIIETAVGGGTSYDDGVPATEAQISEIDNIAFDAAGNLYITQSRGIRRIDTNGIITTVISGYDNIRSPYGIDVDSDGNIYYADVSLDEVFKIDANGVKTRVAGSYNEGYTGDGGPAVDARLDDPAGIAVDSVGNLYIADSSNGCVRKVDTSGIITTAAHVGALDIAIDGTGNLYVSSNYTVHKVDTSGMITRIAGTGQPGYSGDGGAATEARFDRAEQIDVDAGGNLYIADKYNHCIRKVDTNGIITTVAGSGTSGYSGDGGPATEAQLSNPMGVAVDPKGNLYVADSFNKRIRKVAAFPIVFEAMGDGDVAFVEENGPVYIMYSDGRHKMTLDPDTGAILFQFGYDTGNKLVSITDRFNNAVTIERNSNGIPTAVTSPDGLRTELVVDANNHLTRITDPNADEYIFEYTTGGLLTAKTEPQGNRFVHDFNTEGRMTEVSDQEGGHWYYNRAITTVGDILTEVLSGEGNQTTYLDHFDSIGAYRSVITGPAGAQTLFEMSADGLTVNKSLPCGMDVEFKYALDPEYKFKVTKEMTETTPSTLEKITLRDKTYLDTDADDIPDLITETVTVNGKTTTLANDVLAFEKTITSPEARTVTIQYDPDTLLTESVSEPGLFDTSYGYDDKGRPTSISTNTRVTSFTYNAQGFLESITDPEDHTTTYEYDAVGRVTNIDRPDGNSVGFAYDKNGNLTVLTNPTPIDHGFGFNKVNLNSSYQTPLSGSYSYIYDKDRRLIQTNFPTGNQINNIYTSGRLAQIQTPEGNIDYTYLCGTKVESITKGTESITYGYDGKLVTSETMAGFLGQSLFYNYNNDFNLTGFTYAGSTVNYTYDDDGLLTGAGSFSITRNAGNGLPEVVTGGVLSLTRSFNGYGEVSGEHYAVSGQGLTSWTLTRDNNGRITNKTETVNGITSDYVYSYDPMGRLLTVTKDSTLVEEYDYDANGTRIYEMNTLRGITDRSYSYDDEDHLLTAGTTTYQYNLDGFLTTKTQGVEVTTYDYSSRGELLSVTLPDGTVIEYIHDPLGRRIAKKVNGTITEKYLWQGLTRLLAVYDNSDSLLMRFEYTDGRMPVAMIKSTSTYYLTYDQIGSLRIVADASGNVVKKIEYDSFGNIIDDTNPSFEIPFGFAGGLHDRDTGLVRFGVRDYDPDIGRWTAKDPIFFAGGDTDLYGYCLNNPINFVDPWGLFLDPAFSPSSSQEYGHMWKQEYGNQGPSMIPPFPSEEAKWMVDIASQTLAEELSEDYISGTFASVLRRINFFLNVFDPFPSIAEAPEFKSDYSDYKDNPCE